MAKKTTKKKEVKILQIIIAILIAAFGGYFAKDYVLDPYEPLPLEEYYLEVEGLGGEAFINKLHEIINRDFKALSYSKAKNVLMDADVAPDDDTKVLTIYSREKVERDWGKGNNWHREHVWPNSRLGLERVDESDKNRASDLHNLRAIVPSVNSSRSNKVFDETTSSNTFYPGDEDKGDVARILFYMIIMYPDLELVDEVLPNDTETNYLPEGAKMAKLSVLLKWHEEDRVDDFERHRNNVIYEAQRNRNPFIDHPEFVYKIFDIKEEQETASKNKLHSYYYIIITDLRRKEEFLC